MRSGDTRPLSSSKASLTSAPSYGKKPSRNFLMMIRALGVPARSVSAARSASASRVGSEVKTTQVNAGGVGLPASVSTVPPQPISRSSQWAPRHKTCLTGGSNRSNRTLSMRRRVPPDPPRGLAAGFHVVELLLVLEGVHAGPEARVSIGQQLLLLDQASERLLHELFAGL